LANSARPGRARNLGMLGVGLMLGCALLRLALSLAQTQFYASSSTAEDIQRGVALFSGAHMLLNLVSLGGLLVLIWALCRATQPQAPPP
jgi:hypothetical protein